jgi:type II secretory pathway predicted ATPase ExeA
MTEKTPRLFFQTRAAQIALQSLDRIVEEEIIGVVIGNPGLGKTECIQAWRKKQGMKIPHIWIEADVVTSPRPILNALVEGLGISPGPNMWANKKLIESALTDRPLPVIFDETDLFTDRSCELLRSIWDQVSARRGSSGERGFPLALFGAPKLLQMLDRPDLERLHRRIFHVAQLPPLDPGELRKILSTKWAEFSFDDESLDQLLRISRGSFGWVNTIMGVAARLARKNGNAVNLRILKAVRRNLAGLPEE